MGIASNLNAETLNEMEQRIGQMGVVELQERRAYLLQEQEGTQNPSRLKEIAAELSAIQKALVALVGAAVISNITDDGYNDNVPPVITINLFSTGIPSWLRCIDFSLKFRLVISFRTGLPVYMRRGNSVL